MSDEVLPESAYAFLDAAAVNEEPEPVDQLVQPCRKHRLPRTKGGKTTAEDRCEKYIATIDPGVQGQNGSCPMFRAACIIVRFGITDRTIAFQLLSQYGARCTPPWTSEAEINHKLDDACKNEPRRDFVDCDPPEWSGYGEESPSGHTSSSDTSSSNLASPVQITDDGKKTKSKPPPCHAEILLELASSAKLFHTPDERCFASIEVDGHRENHEIKSTVFRRWLFCRFYKKELKPPTAEAFQSALGVLEAQATFDAQEEHVYVRVAPGPDGSIYIDLGNPAWNAVKVTSARWEVVADLPVRFIRLKGARPLPVPDRGGSLEELRKFLNIDDREWLLFLAWLTQALRPVGPYPVLTLGGEAGTAKSTMAKIARSVIDPHIAMLRSEPRENRDLMICACNNWLIAVDNLSNLSSWMSDAFCRLVTGGGFATRSLYTDTEETYLDASRPIIIAAIEDVVKKGDLADRRLVITLQPIPEKNRRLEDELWASFKEAAPGIMAAILDALVGGLGNLPAITLESFPRMADFAKWGEAVCRGIGKEPGAFLAVYSENRQEASAAVLEGSPVAIAIETWITQMPGLKWEGTASDFLTSLATVAGEKVTATKGWPKTPRVLSGVLRRLAPDLRKVGVDIDFAKQRQKKLRPIAVTWSVPPPPDKVRDSPSPASPASPNSETTSKTEDEVGDGRKIPQRHPASPPASPSVTTSVTSVTQRHQQPSKTDAGDAGDAGDGESRTLSGGGSYTFDTEEWDKIKNAF